MLAWPTRNTSRSDAPSNEFENPGMARRAIVSLGCPSSRRACVCLLAILLIDAGATLNDEDIGTLRLLYEGGIPAVHVLYLGFRMERRE